MKFYTSFAGFEMQEVFPVFIIKPIRNMYSLPDVFSLNST